MARYFSLVVFLAVSIACAMGDELTRAEEAIVRSMLDNYSEEKRHVRPNNNTDVEFGMTLAAINNLDDTGVLTAVGWIKMKWTDSRLIWSDSNVDHITFPINRLWKPDIELYNGLNYEQPINREVYPLVYSNGMVLWIPPFSLKVKCVPSQAEGWEWDCSPKFGSWVYDSNKLVLKEYEGNKNIVIDEDIEFPGWEVDNPEGKGVEHRYYDCCPNVPYSSIKFLIRVRRDPAWAKSGSNTLSAHYVTLLAILGFSLY